MALTKRSLFSLSAYFSAFWVLLVVFALTRFVGLMNKPVENDEPLYVQYMQQMHDDFAKNKWVSVKNSFGEWKPPLSFWYGSHFMDRSQDPILSARFSVALMALLGFGVLMYLIWRVAQSVPFVYIYGALIIFNPVFMLYDKFVMQEAIVYSIWYIYLLCGYMSFHHALRKEWSPTARRWAGVFLATLGLFLAKQTGEVFVLTILPLAAVCVYLAFYKDSIASVFTKKALKSLAVLILASWLLILVARVVYKWIYPEGVYAIREINDKTYNHTFSIQELLSFPIENRISNIQGSVSIIQDGWGRYFVIGALLLLIAATYISIRKKKWTTAVFLLVTLLFLSAPYVIIVKNFRQNAVKFLTNMNFFFLLIVAWALWIVREYAKPHLQSLIKKRWEYQVLWGVVVILLASHIINAGYYTVVAYDFNKVIFEFPLSKISECYENETCGRDSYINLEKWLEYLVNEQKKGEVGVVFIDPQRWHPGTYLQVYQKYFPNLRIVGALQPAVLTQMEDIKRQIKQQNPNGKIYYVFDGSRERGYPKGDERWATTLAETWECPNKLVIDKHSKKTNLVICKFE